MLLWPERNVEWIPLDAFYDIRKTFINIRTPLSVGDNKGLQDESNDWKIMLYLCLLS